MDEIRLQINLPTDDEGMFGRECPKCKEYFKVKDGTGLANISTCTCPYCEHTEESNEFVTTAQMEYIKSIAVRQVIGPALKELEQSFRDLERSTRHSFISFKVKSSGFDFPIKYYSESDLETTITCDHCGLVFAVFGIFATCPDCTHLSAMSMFRNSLETIRKRFAILDRISNDETDIRDAFLIDLLSSIVATFDGLGKRVQLQFASLIPNKPRNLFQNLDALNDLLSKKMSITLSNLLEDGGYQKLYYLFQLRHIWNHNLGEADGDFIRKTNSDPAIMGTIIYPTEEEIIEFLELVETLGNKLYKQFQELN